MTHYNVSRSQRSDTCRPMSDLLHSDGRRTHQRSETRHHRRRHLRTLDWQSVTPNPQGDWINQRDTTFPTWPTLCQPGVRHPPLTISDREGGDGEAP